MRIDGTTCPTTHLDDETGAILLRRLHPRIASYNDLIIFLMKSNMDIKFIGSGEAAKALLYYVTDYITKASLPTHVGLAALSYAIQKTNEQFPHMVEGGNEDNTARRSKGALNKSVNRMMSQQEISHQQVMSYLVGGGDVYTSHLFKVLHWGSFDRLFQRAFPQILQQPESSERADVSEQTAYQESFVLTINSDSISAANQTQDYVYRSQDAVFKQMCLYEFAGSAEKVTRTRDKRRLGTEGDGIDAREHEREQMWGNENEGVDEPTGTSGLRGRPRQPRGLFSSDRHTQFRTHVLRLRRTSMVPVILGERIPRSDRDDKERESWARMMLILFVPWRAPSDLRHVEETWCEAFERQRELITPKHVQIIANMNVLSECRDVRDEFRETRRKEAMASIQEGLLPGEHHTGREDETHQEFELFAQSDPDVLYDDVNDNQASQSALDSSIGTRGREAFDACFGVESDTRHSPSRTQNAFPQSHLEEMDASRLTSQAATMRRLKSNRRPRPPEDNDGSGRPVKRRRLTRHVQENVTQERLRNETSDATEDKESHVSSPVRRAIDQVIEEMGLKGNPEQERAFRIVADHVESPEEQLLMYIAGVGGTGKTHVIKAILRLFKLLGR
ncbi:hypothetical protein FKP32DRAFT_1528047, partial [Trametes sanguinea]